MVEINFLFINLFTDRLLVSALVEFIVMLHIEYTTKNGLGIFFDIRRDNTRCS